MATVNEKALVYNLGDGYFSSEKRIGKFRCVEAEEIGLLKKAESLVFSNFDDREKQGADRLSAELNYRLDFRVLGSNGGGEILSEHKIKEDELNFEAMLYVKMYEVYLGSSVGGESKLSKLGQGIYDKDRSNFHKLCGDSFIAKHSLGSILQMRMSFKYSSKADQQKFAANFSIERSFFMLKAKLELDIESIPKEYREELELELSIMQYGGNVFKLGSILPNDGFVTCSLRNVEDLEGCEKIIDKMMNYLVNEIAQQIDDQDDEKVLTGLAVIGTEQQSYEVLGLELNNVIDIRESLAGISEQYEEYSYYQGLIEKVLNASSSLGYEMVNDGYKSNVIDLLPYSKIMGGLLGLTRVVDNSYWRWHPDMLFVKEREKLKVMLEKVNHQMGVLEAYESWCYDNREKCGIEVNLRMRQNEGHLEGLEQEIRPLSKVYKMIARCDDQVYIRYLLPIINQVKGFLYKEDSKFKDSVGNEFYSRLSYTIDDNNLWIGNRYCGEIGKNSEGLETLVGEIYDKYCRGKICFSEDVTELSLLLFMEESPL